MAARHLDDLDQVAEREPVRVDLFFAHEPELAGVQQQRRDAQALGRRRWRAELAVHRDDCASAIAHPKTPIGVVHEMLAHLLLEELARRRSAGVETGGDRILGRCEGLIGTLELREVVADVRQELDCRVEQRCALDSFRDEAASSSSRRPPYEWPTQVAFRTPSASSVSSTSCACVAIVHGGSQSGAGMSAEIGGENMEAVARAAPRPACESDGRER